MEREIFPPSMKLQAVGSPRDPQLSPCDPSDIDQHHHLSGAWSYKLQEERAAPAGKKSSHYESGNNQFREGKASKIDMDD